MCVSVCGSVHGVAIMWSVCVNLTGTDHQICDGGQPVNGQDQSLDGPGLWLVDQCSPNFQL